MVSVPHAVSRIFGASRVGILLQMSRVLAITKSLIQLTMDEVSECCEKSNDSKILIYIRPNE